MNYSVMIRDSETVTYYMYNTKDADEGLIIAGPGLILA